VAEGCHVTSMAGTYMSIVEGFGGMRIYEGKLHFNPFIPDKWDLYSFIVEFRERQIKVEVDKEKTTIYHQSGEKLSVFLYGKEHQLKENEKITDKIKHS
jgi:maltose phosphorylase